MKYMVYERNSSINAIATGKPGMGKSWGMLSMAQQLDPDFELEGNFFFNAGEMFKAIQQDDHKPGKLWLFDEAGIDLNNLRYFDEINKGFNAFFQTARHRNYIFMMSVPFMNVVSKGVRTLMTTSFRAEGWNRKNQTLFSPRVMEYNGDLDRFYRKRLLVRQGTQIDFCNKIALRQPSKKLLEEYEALKKEFTGDLFSDIAQKIEAFEKKNEDKKQTIVLTDKQEDVLNLIKEGKVIFNGYGRGDGVGLCLYSATAMAQNGENALKILGKFFPKTLVYNLSDPHLRQDIFLKKKPTDTISEKSS